MKVYNPLGRTGFFPVMLAVLACVLFSNPLSAAECDASFDPASGKAVLPCINAGNGAAMFDIEMQQLQGLEFKVSRIRQFLYDQDLNDNLNNQAHVVEIQTQFVVMPGNDLLSRPGSSTWLAMVIQATTSDFFCRKDVRATYSSQIDRANENLRIDVRLFLEYCLFQLPNAGPRQTTLSHIFNVTNLSTVDIYIGGKLRKTVQVPPASAQ